MSYYRCYFIGEHGKFVAVEEADHPDDDTASAWGAQLLAQKPDYRGCEVWQLDRVVCRHVRSDPAGESAAGSN